VKRGRVTINSERCKACGLCIRACPVQVLGYSSEMNSAGVHPSCAVNPDRCIACGSCYVVCPDVCIEVIELEGDER